MSHSEHSDHSDAQSVPESTTTIQTKMCNTCLSEKPLSAFKINGLKEDGSKYRTNKCRQCLGAPKVNPANDNEKIRIAKISAVHKALSVSERAMELIASI